ncbi:hypothetical protein P5673_004004 [Acropora cervicornis]|uniref:Ubiquitin-like protease family profile domain-containing protein n=1 Tax=Acropora cervicornis TaxID=6130 RepID=A0AAD9VEB2_ACRCE|nr:hypothetical protein P5673_004004 [Acropora cervicornis]
MDCCLDKESNKSDVSIPEDPISDGSQEADGNQATYVSIPEDPMSDVVKTDGNHAISSDVEITDNVSRSAGCTCTFANLCMQNTEELVSDIHLGLPEEIRKCCDNSSNVNLRPSGSSLAQLVVNGSIEFGELDGKGDTNEEKWIPNFMIDSYLQLIKSEYSPGQLAVEKIKDKKLLQQDIILIPCNSGGRHWVLCAILSKKMSIITVKPSTQAILSKVMTMLRLTNSTTDFQQEEWSLNVNM